MICTHDLRPVIPMWELPHHVLLRIIVAEISAALDLARECGVIR